MVQGLIYRKSPPGPSTRKSDDCFRAVQAFITVKEFVRKQTIRTFFRIPLLYYCRKVAPILARSKGGTGTIVLAHLVLQVTRRCLLYFSENSN